MKHLSPRELSYRLSLFVDGALDSEEARELEAYIARHPEAAKELNDLRTVKHLLAAKEPVSPNPSFWTRFSAALEQRRKEEENLLPFPRKYLPYASVAGVIATLAVGFIVFQQRAPLMEYFTEKSRAVQEAYETGVLKGAIFPVFKGVDNDKVLQFTLFGTLPLDEKSGTALRVDERAEKGYRIEMGLTAPQQTPGVTMKDFMKQVQPTAMQAELIDSVLSEAGGHIEKSAFYAENNALAIDPELSRLNRVVLTSIAAVLKPRQRERLGRFLEERHAAFAIASGPLTALPSPDAHPQIFARMPDDREYLIITPESLTVATIAFDLKGEGTVEGRGERTPVPPDLSLRIERLLRPRVQQRVMVRSPHPRGRVPVQIFGDEGFFKIEIGPQFEQPEPDSHQVWVTPREHRTRFFRFEHRPPDVQVRVFGTPPEGEMEMKIDTMVRRFMEQDARREPRFRKLDSLMKAKARKLSGSAKGVVVDSADSDEDPVIWSPDDSTFEIHPPPPPTPKQRKKSETKIETR